MGHKHIKTDLTKGGTLDAATRLVDTTIASLPPGVHPVVIVSSAMMAALSASHDLLLRTPPRSTIEVLANVVSNALRALAEDAQRSPQVSAVSPDIMAAVLFEKFQQQLVSVFPAVMAAEGDVTRRPDPRKEAS